MERYACPGCQHPLQRVVQSKDSLLNHEQFEAVKLGDWFCFQCPKGDAGYNVYYWDRELGVPEGKPGNDLPLILAQLRTLRDGSEGDIRHAYNEVCDRLDVLISMVQS